MEKEKMCYRCVYYKSLDESRGQCRFEPPRIFQWMNGLYADSTEARFPVIKPEDFCGKFEEVFNRAESRYGETINTED